MPSAFAFSPPLRTVRRRSTDERIRLSTVESSTDLADPPHRQLRGLDRPDRASERARYLAEVFADHHRALRSFLGRFLRNDDDIADTVQDVFVRIAQIPDPSKLDQNPRAYLFRTAERLVIDRVRSEQFRQVHLHDPLLDQEIQEPSASIEAQV
ncbi:MAG: RNA polymerase sigma factor, partial [Betaproteobacteria bacterium]